MLNKIFSLGPAVILGLALLVPAAQAAPVRIGIFGNLGYGIFAMDDVNQDFIQSLNDYLASAGSPGIYKIRGGVVGDLGIKFIFSDHWMAGASLDYLSAYTHADVSSAYLPGGAIDINLPAVEGGAFFRFVLPASETVMLTAGGELDYLYLSGKIKSSSTILSPGFEDTWTGSALGFKLVAGAEFFLGSYFALNADIGYRFARFPEIRNSEGLLIVEDEGGNFTVDYSGPFVQGGVSVYF